MTTRVFLDYTGGSFTFNVENPQPNTYYVISNSDNYNYVGSVYDGNESIDATNNYHRVFDVFTFEGDTEDIEDLIADALENPNYEKKPFGEVIEENDPQSYGVTVTSIGTLDWNIDEIIISDGGGVTWTIGQKEVQSLTINNKEVQSMVRLSDNVTIYEKTSLEPNLILTFKG